jgi:hypothetical protein
MHIYKCISFGLTHAFQADATRHAGHRRRDVHRVPPKFFDDAPYHPRVRHRYLIIVFSDFCVICTSPLEHTYPRPPHAHIIYLAIHLHIDAHTLKAFPRYSNATTTIHTMRHPDCTFSSGPEARSFTCRVDGMMRGSSCRSVAYR